MIAAADPGMTLEEIEAEIASYTGMRIGVDGMAYYGARCESLRAARAYIQMTGCARVRVLNEDDK